MAAIMVVAMITTIDMTGAITIDDMTTDMIDATMIDGMTATGLVTTETTDTCRFTGGGVNWCRRRNCPACIWTGPLGAPDSPAVMRSAPVELLPLSLVAQLWLPVAMPVMFPGAYRGHCAKALRYSLSRGIGQLATGCGWRWLFVAT